MIGHLKASDLPAHRSAAPPSAPIVLMKHVLLQGPWRRHLHAGLINLGKLRPLRRRPRGARPRLSPDWSFHQHPAPNELEDGGQREERKEGNKGKLWVQTLCTNKEALYLMKVALLFRIGHTQRTGLSGRGDLTTLTFKSVINGQAVNYFSLLGGLSSHTPQLCIKLSF